MEPGNPVLDRSIYLMVSGGKARCSMVISSLLKREKELWRTIRSHKECRNLAYEFVTRTFDNLVEAALSQNADFAYEGHFPE